MKKIKSILDREIFYVVKITKNGKNVKPVNFSDANKLLISSVTKNKKDTFLILSKLKNL